MKLSHTLAGASTAALLVLTPAAAYAQEADALGVKADQACGRVTLTATVGQNFGENDTYEIGVFSGPNAGGAASTPEGQFTVSADQGTVSQTFTLDEDAYDGSGFVRWVTLSGPNPEFYVNGVVGVETDCGAEAPAEDADDEDATPDEDAPAVTPYQDCEEAHADGRSNIPTDDPRFQDSLDPDDDGIGCEFEEGATGPGASDPQGDPEATPAPTAEGGDAQANPTVNVTVPAPAGDFDQIDKADVPKGGVETGGGPA